MSFLSKLSIVTFLSVSAAIWAQKVNGIFILNKKNGAPLEHFRVSNSEESFYKYTDELGYAELATRKDIGDTLYVSGKGIDRHEVEISKLKTIEDKAYLYLLPTVGTVTIKEITLHKNNGSSVFQPLSDLDIKLRPVNNSQEVLRAVPGLFIGQHAGGGKAEQLFIRGFDIDHGTDISLNVDGIPVNMVSHAHGQGYADLHFVIPELIEKIDFDKGPYFADKGNFATAGYVDFQTRSKLDRNFVKAEAGQFGTLRGVVGVDLLKGSKNNNLLIGGEFYGTNGYFEHPQDFERWNGLLKYSGKVAENSFLSASFTAMSSEWNASGQIPDRAVEGGSIGWFGAIDPNEGGKTSRYNLGINLKSYLSNGGTLTSQFYFSKYLFELYSNFTFFLNDPINGDQIKQKENRNLYGGSVNYQKSFRLFNLPTETNVGVQVRTDDIRDLELSRTKDRILTTEQMKFGNVLESNYSTYWQQKFYLNDKWDIAPSIRADYFENSYQDKLSNETTKANYKTLSPKLQINYNASDKSKFYLYLGKGFHSNDSRVVVTPESRRSTTPGLGADLGTVLKIGNKLLLQTAAWYLWLQDEFVYVGDEAIVEASGKTQRYGLDLSARYEIFKSLFADLDLSLANPRSIGIQKSESYLPLAPRIVSTGGLTYKKEKGLNGSVRYRFMGDRPANEDNSVVAKGYFIWDGVVNYTMKNWVLGLSLQNLFNVKWKETQFDTESRLYNEIDPVSEIHFTPGTPFFAKLSLTRYF